MDLQELTTKKIQQVEIPASFINKLLHDHGLHHTIQIYNGSMVFSADNFTATFKYHSHNFDNGNPTINFCLITVKPFYYSFGLPLINKRYPYLGYWKDEEGNTIITCFVNKIPGIDGILKDYRQYKDHTTIESFDCKEDAIVIGLRTTSGWREGDVQTKIQT